MGVDAVLCVWPAAGVVAGSPGSAALSWVAPALVMVVGGGSSTSEGPQVHALTRGGVLLGGEGGGSVSIRPPVWPIRHIQIGTTQDRAHWAWWGVG